MLVSLMVTPRGDDLQVYSLIGDRSMRLRWVPGTGGYVRAIRSTDPSMRAMRVVVTKQTQIDGAWTAQALVAELRSWEPAALVGETPIGSS